MKYGGWFGPANFVVLKVFSLFGGTQVATCMTASTCSFSFSDWLRNWENQQKYFWRVASHGKMYWMWMCVFFCRRKRQNSDTALDDRDEFSNGRPMRMKRANRKRRTLQKKRLMGSTESLGGLEELAASRASKNYNNLTLWLLCCLSRASICENWIESHNVAKVVFLLIIITTILRFVHVCIWLDQREPL